MMTACDLAAITKPWEIQVKVKKGFDTVCILTQLNIATIVISEW